MHRMETWLLPLDVRLRRSQADAAADLASFIAGCCAQCRGAPDAVAVLNAWRALPHGRAKTGALPAVLEALRRFGLVTTDAAETLAAGLMHESRLAARRAKRAAERALLPRKPKPKPKKRLDGCPRRVWH